MPTYTHAHKLQLTRPELVIERDRHLLNSAPYNKWQDYINHYDACESWVQSQLLKVVNDRGNLDTAPVPPTP